MLANIIETFYLEASKVIFRHLPPPLLFSRSIFKTLFKHLRWSLFVCPYNTKPTDPAEEHLPIKQTGTITIFFFQIPSYLWPIHSFDKTYVLLVTVELIWLLLLNILSFNFVPRRTNFRLARFRRSYVKRPAVVLTSCTSYTAFLLDVRCAVQNDHVSFFAAVCP